MQVLMRAISIAVVSAAVCAAAAAAQTPPPPQAAALPRLAVTAALLTGLPRRTLTVTEEKGESVTYSGVDLDALLAKNGAPQGLGLHGAAAADYALVRAADGYRTTFALAEIDPTITDKVVLLADTRNGSPLDAKLGPFRIIVPGEKHRLRWIRNVVEVDVMSPP